MGLAAKLIRPRTDAGDHDVVDIAEPSEYGKMNKVHNKVSDVHRGQVMVDKRDLPVETDPKTWSLSVLFWGVLIGVAAVPLGLLLRGTAASVVQLLGLVALALAAVGALAEKSKAH